MQLHEVLVSTRKKEKRVGRGGKRGTTSGRGTKGQRARAGHRIRPEIRDLIKRIPKRRGVKLSIVNEKSAPLDLDILEENFKPGEKVTPRVLAKRGLLQFVPGRSVKILGHGKLTKKLILENIDASHKAAQAIIAAGGELRHIDR